MAVIRTPGATTGDVNAAVQAALARVNVAVSPTEGQTVILPSTGRDLFVNLTPAADLNAITVTLPPEAVSGQNQRLVMRSSRNILAVTVNGATTVDNSEVMLNAGSVTVFFKFAPNLWSRTV